MIDKEDKDSNLHIALEMISRVECIRELSKFAIERVDYYNALADYWSLWFRIRYLTLYDFEHCHPISVESFVES